MKTQTYVIVAEKILAILGAVASLVVVFLFGVNQLSIPSTRFMDLFPLPGLYFLEIITVCLISTALILREPQSQIRWQIVFPWLCAGILLAFVILGAWTIGLFLIPALVFYLSAGILADLRTKGPLGFHFSAMFMAALLQAALILLLVLL